MKKPITTYYDNDAVRSRMWCRNSHNNNLPAIIYYYSSGKVKSEHWWINGKYHRTTGPALIKRYQSGEIFLQKWYLHNKEIFPYEWLQENRYRWPLNKEKEIEFLLRFG